MDYSFDHCADFYEESRQRQHAPVQTLIRSIKETGVELDHVVDFGSGTGFWLRTLHEASLSRGRALGIDISPRMIQVARRSAPWAQFKCGGLKALRDLDLAGFQTIFSCMTIHLLSFPQGLAELTSHASKHGVKDLILVEEVSSLYYAVTGNPGYRDSLPSPIGAVLNQYSKERAKRNYPDLDHDRPAPFPTPPMSLEGWRLAGLPIKDYTFHALVEHGWSWHFSASDLVAEIERRSYSVYFEHPPDEAHDIAASMRRDLEPMALDTTKYKIPYWFQWHRFRL